MMLGNCFVSSLQGEVKILMTLSHYFYIEFKCQKRN